MFMVKVFLAGGSLPGSPATWLAPARSSSSFPELYFDPQWRLAEFEASSKDLEEKMGKSLKINQVDKDAFVAASKPVYEEFSKEVKGGKEVVDRILSLR